MLEHFAKAEDNPNLSTDIVNKEDRLRELWRSYLSSFLCLGKWSYYIFKDRLQREVPSVESGGGGDSWAGQINFIAQGSFH